MRRFAFLTGSVIAVVVLGALAALAQLSSSARVDRVHRADRVTLQKTLAGLTDQYMQFTFLATNTAAGSTSWQLTPNAAADRAQLQSLVTHSPLTTGGAALVSLAGAPLTSYPSAAALPPPTDRGYVPMRRALLAGQPGLSDVMHARGVPLVAFAVPVTRDHRPGALLVTFADLRTWPLQGYSAKLHVGKDAQAFVVDSSGVVAAASNAALIGKPFPSLPPQALSGSAGVTSIRHGLVASYGPAGRGWASMTTQPSAAYSGELHRGRELELLALALLLSLVVLLLIVMHHKRQQALARLAEERLHDPLTGLGQRGVFEMRVQAAIARRRRHQRPLAVLYCDLDDFKGVNDRYGHNTGDQLLAVVAERLRQAVRDTDMVARLGGDEFAVVMEETTRAEAQVIAERVLRELREPLVVNGRQLTPGASLGAAVLESADAGMDEVLHEADMAMYQAKREGLGVVVVSVSKSGRYATANPPTMNQTTLRTP